MCEVAEGNKKILFLGNDMVKSKYADKQSGFLKANMKVPLMIIILPNEVDGDG